MQKYSFLFTLIMSKRKRRRKTARFKVNKVSFHWRESRNPRMQCRVAQSRFEKCSSPPAERNVKCDEKASLKRLVFSIWSTHIKRIVDDFVSSFHEITEQVDSCFLIYRSHFNELFEPNAFISRLIIYQKREWFPTYCEGSIQSM